MADTKLVSESEREAGIILQTDDPQVLGKEATREEWDKIVQQYGYLGVDWANREAWLADNGYEVNRANLRDQHLALKAEPAVE